MFDADCEMFELAMAVNVYFMELYSQCKKKKTDWSSLEHEVDRIIPDIDRLYDLTERKILIFYTAHLVKQLKTICSYQRFLVIGKWDEQQGRRLRPGWKREFKRKIKYADSDVQQLKAHLDKELRRVTVVLYSLRYSILTDEQTKDKKYYTRVDFKS